MHIETSHAWECHAWECHVRDAMLGICLGARSSAGPCWHRQKAPHDVPGRLGPTGLARPAYWRAWYTHIHIGRTVHDCNTIGADRRADPGTLIPNVWRVCLCTAGCGRRECVVRRGTRHRYMWQPCIRLSKVSDRVWSTGPDIHSTSRTLCGSLCESFVHFR